MSTSPVKWLTDKAYAAARFPERVVAHADSQVGTKESGWNRGAQVTEYQRVAGLGSGGGFAWCASFVYWCCLQAGADAHRLPAKGACAAVRNWRSWAEKSGRLRTGPARGSLFYWVSSKGTGHIGVCIGPSVLGVFRTIEGNTDAGDGSREGDGVYKRTRTTWGLKRNRHSGFIDLEGL